MDKNTYGIYFTYVKQTKCLSVEPSFCTERFRDTVIVICIMYIGNPIKYNVKNNFKVLKSLTAINTFLKLTLKISKFSYLCILRC